jgi:hypothetical protein
MNETCSMHGRTVNAELWALDLKNKTTGHKLEDNISVNLKLSLCLPKDRATKAYGGAEVDLHRF